MVCLLLSYARAPLGRSKLKIVACAAVVFFILIYSFHNGFNFISDNATLKLLLPDKETNSEIDNNIRKAVRIRKRKDGRYVTSGRINNKAIKFIVDTGANSVILTSKDANAVGINKTELQYDIAIHTFNGSEYAAAINLEMLEIGLIVMYNVDALVLGPTSLSESLLGMSFLSRLKSFKFSKDFLTLRN
ncbi:MAG: hypothetical protein TECD_00110 [Hyphomicrobiaceae bacterium hypho_1]